MNNTALIIHGGAGDPPNREMFRASLSIILEKGKALIESGASALETVEHCVMLLENDALFNAGKGSVLNSKGHVEMDAAIMDGRTMRAGGVTSVTNVRNPIHLARLVMDNTEHVLLTSAGAMEFAREQGVTLEPDAYFITPERMTQLEEAKKRSTVMLDHSSSDKKLGTVGAVARDKNGNLAAATSTGGIVNKRFGRVGDTPIPGAGVYAENETCAVSATGFGEQIIRASLAKHIADIIRYKGVDAAEAAKGGIAHLVEKVNGLAGVIVIDAKGRVGVAHSTPAIIASGWSSAQGDFLTL